MSKKKKIVLSSILFLLVVLGICAFIVEIKSLCSHLEVIKDCSGFNTSFYKDYIK